MAEAQYMPYQSDVAGQFYRGAEFGQNFMQRRQRMQWEQEDRDQQKRQRELAEPVVAAKLQADQASALATLDTFKQQQQLKTRFATEAPIANEEFQKAMQLPTYNQQERTLAILQQKYAWMGLIPDGRGFVDTLNNSRAQAFQYSLTNKKINAEMAAIDARNQAEQEQIRLRGQQSRETAAFAGEQTRQTNAARPRLTDPAQRDALRIRTLREQATALQDTDPETAELLFKRAEYLANPNAISGGGGLSPAMKAILGITDDQPTTGGAPATGTTGAPVPAAPVRTTQEIIGEIKF